jgi:hypothetical protein
MNASHLATWQTRFIYGGCIWLCWATPNTKLGLILLPKVIQFAGHHDGAHSSTTSLPAGRRLSCVLTSKPGPKMGYFRGRQSDRDSLGQ